MSYTSLESYTKDFNYIYIYSFTANCVFKFPAFLTGISDSRKCNWSTNDIYGRMDSIYTYKNTVRKLSISFDVPVDSLENAKKYQYDLQIGLKHSVYPVYKERPITSSSFDENAKKYIVKIQRSEKKEYVLSTPPYHRIRFCNLIKSKEPFTHSFKDGSYIKDGLLGWIDGYTFSPKIENGFYKDGNNIYAKLFSVSLNLNVLHEHFLGYRWDGKQIVDRSEKIIKDTSEVVQTSTNAVTQTSPETPAQETYTV